MRRSEFMRNSQQDEYCSPLDNQLCFLAAAVRCASQRCTDARSLPGREAVVVTKSCQIAIAFRPRPSASAISSRNASQALALGARPGGATGASTRNKSVDTLWWPVLPDESRWTHRAKWPLLPRGLWTPPAWWPVLAARCGAERRARAPGCWRPSDIRWPSHDERPSFLRSGGATSRVARAPQSAAVCDRPRRCSWPRRSHGLPRLSTSQSLRVVANFQVSIDGRFRVSTEGQWRLTTLRHGTRYKRQQRARRPRRMLLYPNTCT